MAPKAPSRRAHHGQIGAAVFVAVLAVYSRTSFPSVTGGDAGELLAESCQLGMAHPPGYPLFIVLNHLAFRVAGFVAPGVSGAPALAANLLSCSFGAAAAAFLALSVLEWNYGRAVPAASAAGAVVGAALFAFSPLAWEYHVGAEVFALNNALVSLLLFFTTRVASAAREGGSRGDGCGGGLGWACAGAAVSGLALANQHASLLSVVPLAATVLAWLSPPTAAALASTLLALGACGLLGLSPYCYLVATARKGPHPGSWGDQRTVAGFLKHVLRSEYGTFKMLTFGDSTGKGTAAATESALERTVLWAQDTLLQTRGVGPFLAAVAVLAAVFAAAVDIQRNQRSGGGSGVGESAKAPAKGKAKGVKDKRGGNAAAPAAAATGGSTANPNTGPWRPSVHAEVALALLGALGFYLLVWHGVFSNLPLRNPMAFEVHRRFWMQPGLIVCCFAGDGLAAVLRPLLQLLGGALAPVEAPPSAASGTPVELAKAGGGNQASAGEGSESSSGEGGGGGGWRVGLAAGLAACAVAGAQLQDAWHHGDQRRDGHGWTMHRYGEAMLASLPPNALLLTHTDLDWNTVRYLRSCEGLRPDITHLSVQLLPYPW